MKITFRRDVLANYMVIENVQEFDADDFSVKMLDNNSIKGLLKFGHENINGHENLLYDISSRQAMLSLFETEKIPHERLKGFVESLKGLAESLEGYFLDINNIMLKKECIFMDVSSEKYFYCYNPYYNGDMCVELGILFDEFLSAVDYEDADAVKLAYDLSRESHRENFTAESLFALVKESEEGSCEPFKPQSLIQEENVFAQQREADIYHGDENINQTSEQEPHAGFLKKLSVYLKGKNIYEVAEDIDNGKFRSKIKESMPMDFLKEKKTYNRGREYDFKAMAFHEPAVYMADKKTGEESGKEALIFEGVNLSFKEEQEDFMETALLAEDEAEARFLMGRGSLQGRIMEINNYPYTIGKLKDKVNGICTSSAVSRIHCRIYENNLPEGGYFFEDLNSKNGSFVNNIKVNPYKKMPLRPGDIIKIADEEYVFR